MSAAARPPLNDDEMMRGDLILARIIDFTRLLWELGFDIGPGRVVELAESLSLINIASQDELYTLLKVSLVSKHEQQIIFDLAFAYFWRSPNANAAPHLEAQLEAAAQRRSLAMPEHRRQESDQRVARSALEPDQLQRHPASRLNDARKPRPREDDDDIERSETWSSDEVLRRKDFEQFSYEELQEARELIAKMRWRLGERRTRRLRSSRHGRQLDLRQTLRRSLRTDGEPIILARRRPRMKPRPLIILCDISGSMALYSRLLLHFVHTVSNGLQNVETFLFGTRLTRITRYLARRDVDDAIAHVTRNVQDWSGGTRIGDSLRTFNRQWLRRVLGRGAVVLIISDGWDRGDVTVLAEEMARLHRNCHRLIWLNPLLGHEDYRPVTAGMRAALPYIDAFLPANNLDSLFALGHALEAIDETPRGPRALPVRRAELPARRGSVAGGRG
jgi:uncharacterized protein with von Willebrand factor type A (vWA) domain